MNLNDLDHRDLAIAGVTVGLVVAVLGVGFILAIQPHPDAVYSDQWRIGPGLADMLVALGVACVVAALGAWVVVRGHRRRTTAAAPPVDRPPKR